LNVSIASIFTLSSSIIAQITKSTKLFLL